MINGLKNVYNIEAWRYYRTTRVFIIQAKKLSIWKKCGNNDCLQNTLTGRWTDGQTYGHETAKFSQSTIINFSLRESYRLTTDISRKCFHSCSLDLLTSKSGKVGFRTGNFCVNKNNNEKVGTKHDFFWILMLVGLSPVTKFTLIRAGFEPWTFETANLERDVT